MSSNRLVCIIACATWISLHIITASEACQSGYYGLNCKYICHCDSVQCHPITGCSGNCMTRWSGPKCTRENIALGKTTFQSSYYDHKHGSSLAVDGVFQKYWYADNCILTATDQSSTLWRVNLGREFYIHQIVIYFRYGGVEDRRNGVQVYASTQSDGLNNGYLCGTATSTSPKITTMTCDHTATYITLYQATANTAMDFCEVQVYVCENGTFGNDCREFCHCQGESCLYTTGRCPGSCQPNWTGTQCNACDGAHYGPLCTEICSLRKCYGQSSCNVIGKCDYGCLAGWKGVNCIQRCNDGSYGQNCSLRCTDRHCKDNNAVCDHVTGSCSGQCQAGWQGDTCTDGCNYGSYGENCRLRCTDRHCKDNNAACDHVTGSCGGQCLAGWQGDTCTDGCNYGSYGENCSLRCTDRHCKDNNAACDHVTGSCGGQCQAGWQGDTCTDECRGTYGQNCSLRCTDRHCKDNNAVCDHVTGSCGGQCQAGWQGDTCTDECKGSYGQKCRLRCTDRHCKDNNAVCDHVTGSCGGQCQAGWQEDTCTDECRGSYGQDCSLRCTYRHCKDNAVCDHVTGSCGGQCQAGWQGDTCIEECKGSYGQDCRLQCTDRHCEDNNTVCDHVTGSCHGQCQAGWQGDTCTKECHNGTYGENCAMLCADRHCSDKQKCNSQHGRCEGGCLSGWQGELCLQKAAQGSDVPVVGIAGGIGAVIVVLVIVIVIVVVLRRRQSRNKESTNHTHAQEHAAKTEGRRDKAFEQNVYINDIYVNVAIVKSEQLTDNAKIGDSDVDEVAAAVVEDNPVEQTAEDETESDEEDEDHDVYYNDPRPTAFNLPTVGFPISKLESVIQQIRKQSGGFNAEFLKLPSGFMHPYTESRISQNRIKNRFVGYYPYDNNRVKLTKLKDDAHSDYVNASYVDAYEKKNYFIACQAPNEVTLNDFWRMIWEKNCGQIIMLTNLVEAGKKKCQPYWNDLASMDIGYFNVAVKEISVRADYTIRKLQVTHKKSGKSKTIDHYHFTSWPDHGVPNVLDLLDFFWLTREKSPPTPGHVMVHCSAGIGRTGTYIALHILTDEINRTGRINVLQMMTQIRDQRKNMVQTKDQYECIFMTMLEVARYGQTSVNTATYTQTYAKLKESTLMGKKTISQLAQVIATIETSNAGTSAIKRLWVDGKEDLFVVAAPSKTLKQGYLLVHTPHKTENLLWKLVMENESLTLVTLGDHNDSEFIPQKSQSSKHGKMTVTTINETSVMQEITLRTLRVEEKGCSEKKEIVNFSVRSWSNVADHSTVMGYLTTLIEKLLTRQTNAEPHPVTVIFDESNTREALSLCIMNNIMSQVSCERQVEIFNNVRRFHTVLPNVHFSEEDFKLLCQIPFAHLESTGVYSNM